MCHTFWKWISIFRSVCVAEVKVSDTYNFDSYRDGGSLGDKLNNWAYKYKQNGGGNDYDWESRFTYKTKWEEID